ncbi:APC family permease [Ferroacidibacillus organovorans]|uniref:Amino acid transporter n=1 Tax=Ferroacidibacillus organovorans TaxID=1765683 RepID=A0A101XTA7_9BACL|nr:APC family permease [Ferroacidibacillus organovorans]KUO97197.1 amino acid transporter [Ferroacidibacillus organovorans]
MALFRPWLDSAVITLSVVAILYAFLNFNTFKRVLVGSPMRTRELHSKHNRLFWLIALPILAADLYSSVAYGPEAGITELTVNAHLGVDAKWLILPVTAATVLLLIILVTSYIMGVIAYPNGGGAYAISKDNFKRPIISLIAASSLLIDYVLTVAVSVTAGIQAMASAYPMLVPHETILSVACILLILVVNLRGVSESATIFAWPTFLFMFAMIFLIGTGFVQEFHHGFVQPVTPPFGTIPKELTSLLLLKSFSAACSSLTGIETISNAVPIFREPKTRGAIKAYIALGVITGVTLLGFSYHLYVNGINVMQNTTMESQLLSLYFGYGPIYQIIIWLTFIVLILAANSTFTGFPQLAALVAADSFLPRALMLRGDRLGYSNGMIVLAAFSTILVVVFNAQTDNLIPLYSIGVFVAFTVAQVGLVRYWLREKGSKWRTKLTINLIGSIVTMVVSIVVAVTKFTSGAWIIFIVLPILLFIALSVRRHYTQIANELRIDMSCIRPQSHRVITVVLVSGVNRVVLNALSFAKSINNEVIALYIGFDDESIDRIEKKWNDWECPCRLITVKSEYRSILYPLSRFIGRLQSMEDGKPDHVHVMIAQFVPKKWWHNMLHNQTSLVIRAWLLRHRDVVVTTIPYHLHD